MGCSSRTKTRGNQIVEDIYFNPFFIAFSEDIPGPKHNSAKASITGTVVAVCIGCTLLIGVIIVAAQRWISSKREKTEKADFEFRDDDALSVSSVELFGNKGCFRKFGVWGSRRTVEEVPLCRDTRMYTL